MTPLVTAAAVRVSGRARHSSWKVIVAFVLFAAVVAALVLWLSTSVFAPRKVTTLDYRLQKVPTLIGPQKAATVTVDPSSQASTLAVIGCVSGCVAACAAVAGVVVPLVVKRGATT